MNSIIHIIEKTKMKPIDVNSITYVGFHVENNDKDLKLKVGDHVRISKYKNISTKDSKLF